MSEDAFEIVTTSPEDTEALGLALAAMLPTGCVVALRGDLATGKTCLVRGMTAHFSPGAPIHSPTFTLVNQYGEDRPLYHLDLYRLGSPEEVADLGYEELFDSEGVCVVEWAERAEGMLPEPRVDIDLSHAGGDHRRIVIHDQGLLPPGWQARLRG